jgi:hypothetical protein
VVTNGAAPSAELKAVWYDATGTWRSRRGRSRRPRPRPPSSRWPSRT